MKKFLLILLLVFGTVRCIQAQQKWSLTAAATTCSTSNASCLIYQIDAASGGATFTVSANPGNTLQFEATGDGGTTWVAFNITPSTGAAAVSNTTSTGTWQGNVAGYTAVRIRMSTLASGTSTVSIITSLASARSGGGGGGSGTIGIPAVVSGATSGGIPCFTSSTTMGTSGAVAVNDAITGGGAGACAQDSGIQVYRGARPATNTIVLGNGLSANGTGTDHDNIAIGINALSSEQGAAGGFANVAIGTSACTSVNNSNGTNTCIGYAALSGVTQGNNNVGVGANACTAITTANANTCVGTSSSVAGATDTLELVLGRGAAGAGSNTAMLGVSTQTDAYFGSTTGASYLRGAGLISMNTASKPTLTGTGACATTSTQVGGSTAGTFVCTGTTGASTVTLTFGKTAPNGWACDAWDETTGANLPHQTSHTTTTCVLTVTSVTANDVIVFKAIGF